MNGRIALAAAAMVTALTLSGCSESGSGSGAEAGTGTGTGTASGAAPQSAAGDHKITFMGWGSPEEVAVFKKMIGQYEQKYPGVDVNYVTVPAADFQTKLQTMIASKKIPDVFYLAPENVMPYARSGLITDLTSFAAHNDVFKESNIWPKAIDMYRYDGKTPGQGAIYGLPKDFGPFALAYNKDLFTSAGITAPDPDHPWTWDEFLAAAKKLTTGSGNSKVYGTAPYSLESAVWSNGADWLNADHSKVTVTDPAFVQSLQWVADLSLKEHVAPSSKEEASLPSFQRFVDGKIGMMGIGPWSQGQLWQDAKFEWDLMPWPVSPKTHERATWIGGIGFAVAKSSDDQTDASNLAAFLSSNEDAQRTNMELGQAVPNLVDMAKNEYLKMDKAPANKQEFLRIIEDYGRRATQTYTYNSEWFTQFNANIASVMDGSKTAQEYTTSMQPQMQKLLDKGISEQGN